MTPHRVSYGFQTLSYRLLRVAAKDEMEHRLLLLGPGLSGLRDRGG